VTKLVVNSIKKKVNQIIFTQFIVAIVLALFFWVLSGGKSAVAALCGGLVYIVPCFLYANRLFANVSPQAIKRIIIVFYLGEILKLLVSVGLFVLLMYLINLPLLPYFLGYLVAALSFCIAPLWIMKEKR
jgi:ATP synthase protein I